jgi:hypothetical protein
MTTLTLGGAKPSGSVAIRRFGGSAGRRLERLRGARGPNTVQTPRAPGIREERRAEASRPQAGGSRPSSAMSVAALGGPFQSTGAPASSRIPTTRA